MDGRKIGSGSDHVDVVVKSYPNPLHLNHLKANVFFFFLKPLHDWLLAQTFKYDIRLLLCVFFFFYKGVPKVFDPTELNALGDAR